MQWESVSGKDNFNVDFLAEFCSVLDRFFIPLSFFNQSLVKYDPGRAMIILLARTQCPSWVMNGSRGSDVA